MGRRTRKTRWRTLAIEGERSDSEESNNGFDAEQISNYCQKSYGKSIYSSQSTPTRRYASDNIKSTRSSSTASENKITFNEDEYTRITTPRQDVLFKKGYLNKPKTYHTQTSTGNSTASTGHSTENGTPDHQSTDLDYESQLVFPNGFVDQNGVYYINSFDPYPLMIYNPSTYYTDASNTSNGCSTGSLTDPTSPNNEEVYINNELGQNDNDVIDNVSSNYNHLYNFVYHGFYLNNVCPPQDVANMHPALEFRRARKKKCKKSTEALEHLDTTSEYTDNSSDEVCSEENEKRNVPFNQYTENRNELTFVAEEINNIHHSNSIVVTTLTNNNKNSAVSQRNICSDIQEISFSIENSTSLNVKTDNIPNKESVAYVNNFVNTNKGASKSTELQENTFVSSESNTITTIDESVKPDDTFVKHNLKPDAEEFIPRTLRCNSVLDENVHFIKIVPNFMHVPVLSPIRNFPPSQLNSAFIPPDVAFNCIPASSATNSSQTNDTITKFVHEPLHLLETIDKEVNNDKQQHNAYNKIMLKENDNRKTDIKKLAKSNINNFSKSDVAIYNEKKNRNVFKQTDFLKQTSRLKLNDFSQTCKNFVPTPAQSNSSHFNTSKKDSTYNVNDRVLYIDTSVNAELNAENCLVRQRSNMLLDKTLTKNKLLKHNPLKEVNKKLTRNSFSNCIDNKYDIKHENDERNNTFLRWHQHLGYDVNREKTTNSYSKNNQNGYARTFTNTFKSQKLPFTKKNLSECNKNLKVLKFSQKINQMHETVSVSKSLITSKIADKQTQWIAVSNKKKRKNKNLSDESEKVVSSGANCVVLNESDKKVLNNSESIIPKYLENENMQNHENDEPSAENPLRHQFNELSALVQVNSESDINSTNEVLEIEQAPSLENSVLKNLLVDRIRLNQSEFKNIDETKAKQKKKSKKKSKKSITRKIIITDILDTEQQIIKNKSNDLSCDTSHLDKNNILNALQIPEESRIANCCETDNTNTCSENDGLKKKTKKNKICKQTPNNSFSSLNTALSSSDSYDFLLDNLSAADKTNIEVSQELDMIIQKEMYDSLEEKMKLVNVTPLSETFFKTLLNKKTERDSNVDKNFEIPVFNSSSKNSGCTFKTTLLSVPEFCKSKTLVGVNKPFSLKPETKINLKTNYSNDSGTQLAKEIFQNEEKLEQSDCFANADKNTSVKEKKLYPITEAVRNWMAKTRENTPELEILKSPSVIFKEFCDTDSDTENDEMFSKNGKNESLSFFGIFNEQTNKHGTSVAKSDDEITIFSISRETSEDLQDYWEDQPSYQERKKPIQFEDNLPNGNFKSLHNSCANSLETSEKCYEINKGINHSQFKREEKYSKLQSELEKNEDVKSKIPKHGNLPYRAICCSIM